MQKRELGKLPFYLIYLEEGKHLVLSEFWKQYGRVQLSYGLARIPPLLIPMAVDFPSTAGRQLEPTATSHERIC